jgi:hypothetical protein
VAGRARIDRTPALLEIASFQIFDGPQPLPVLICLMRHINLL